MIPELNAKKYFQTAIPKEARVNTIRIQLLVDDPRFVSIDKNFNPEKNDEDFDPINHYLNEGDYLVILDKPLV